MPKYTKKEWAALCGMNTGNLSNYAVRGQVIYTGDLIDDQLPVNADFLKRRADLLKTKPASTVQDPKTDNTQAAVSEQPSERIHRPNPIPPKADARNKYALEAEKKFYEIENAKVQNDILHEKLLKLRGESIPTDMVTMLFAEQTRNMTDTFKNTLEKHLSQWAKASGIGRDEVAKYRKEITRSINDANKNALAQTKKGLRKIINETSNKKDVGEREIT